MEKETNLEHYLERLKSVVKEAYGSPILIFNSIQHYMDQEIEHNHKDYTSDILDWMAQEYKAEILDYAEKKYLSEVIRPFRKEVTDIVKLKDSAYCQDFIQILVGVDYVSLPHFDKGKMYKGMEYNRAYKPEELGL